MTLNSKIGQSGWHDLMRAFGFSENNETYDKLIKAYTEKHRAYHTLEHINACFRHLTRVTEQAINPHEIELALWFHDAVYKPFSKTNEEDSADMAASFLVKNQATQDVISRISDLILITKEHLAPETQDGKLMLDIDLSVLGTAPAIYEKFEKDVRKEYKRVPSFIFKKKRKEILEGFFERKMIYRTDYFNEQLEDQAKKNLARAVRQL